VAGIACGARFCGRENPSGGLVDLGVVLYGTTVRGGAFEDGTVFQITRQGELTTLYDAGSGTDDGDLPFAPLLKAAGSTAPQAELPRKITDPNYRQTLSKTAPARQQVGMQVGIKVRPGTIDLPNLRIVDPAIWDKVQTRLSTIRTASGADQPDRPKYWEKRRAGHLLTQKVFCGVCGGIMTNRGKDYLGCSKAARQGLGANTKGMRRPEIDALVIDGLRSRLMAPDVIRHGKRTPVEG
jgi:uncharacterized repeat protein (TIGR03803 family)